MLPKDKWQELLMESNLLSTYAFAVVVTACGTFFCFLSMSDKYRLYSQATFCHTKMVLDVAYVANKCYQNINGKNFLWSRTCF